MRGEEIYLMGEFACLVPNLYFEKMYVPTAPWTWACSKQPVSGMRVRHFLPPLRPAWGSVWLGMKCSEARCDHTAKAHPPVSQLSSTKTHCRYSVFKETLIALLQWQKAKWENSLRLYLTRATFLCITNIRKTPSTINLYALTEMDILIIMINSENWLQFKTPIIAILDTIHSGDVKIEIKWASFIMFKCLN